jgi:hypothetical protein
MAALTAGSVVEEFASRRRSDLDTPCLAAREERTASCCQG